MTALTPENICAVVVTYWPDVDFQGRLSRIVPQVGSVVVVDNGSGEPAGSMLQDLKGREKIHVIFNTKNLGVAAALNIGVRWAKSHKYEWVLLCDHDSVLEKSMIQDLIRVYQDFGENSKLAIIGSAFCTDTDMTDSRATGNNRVWIEAKATITSGSLLSVSAFEQIGPFREEFFIDHVDHEYCLRVRQRGFKIIQTVRPLMIHAVGIPSTHRLPWRVQRVPTTLTSNHSAVRRYYMVRNSIVLAREYALREPAWVFNMLYIQAKSIALMLFFERDRWEKLLAACLGVFHGFMGKLGKFEQP